MSKNNNLTSAIAIVASGLSQLIRVITTMDIAFKTEGLIFGFLGGGDGSREKITVMIFVSHCLTGFIILLGLVCLSISYKQEN